MTDRLAILTGAGMLPGMISDAYPDAVVIAFAGVDYASDKRGEKPAETHRFEHLGALFTSLRSQGVDRVVFGGAMSRPPLDPAAFDATMMALAPRLLAAMQMGDDALLRMVIAVFEEQGFGVVGAAQLLPQLTATPGHLAGPEPDKQTIDDTARAAQILTLMSPLDIGQGAVVANGQCIGVETIQGTDAMLGFVAQTGAHLRRGAKGVFVKAAKKGQDLRIDMPAIGPETAKNVAAAGLAGVVIEAGRVMILDRGATLTAFTKEGVFLAARDI